MPAEDGHWTMCVNEEKGWRRKFVWYAEDGGSIRGEAAVGGLL